MVRSLHTSSRLSLTLLNNKNKKGFQTRDSVFSMEISDTVPVGFFIRAGINMYYYDCYASLSSFPHFIIRIPNLSLDKGGAVFGVIGTLQCKRHSQQFILIEF
jgi:hypothetical protein